jgi:hypothetical protein
MPRGHQKLPCSLCGQTPTKFVRERKPGTFGTMAQSFSGTYRLCERHYQSLVEAKAVDRVEPKTKRCEERTTVFAKSFAWLKSIGNG